MHITRLPAKENYVPGKVLLLLLLLFLGTSEAVKAQQAPKVASIDHVEFFVTDLSRSLNFYTRVFGSDLWKNNLTARRYLMLGNTYIALEERETAKIDHYCLGIEDFDIQAMHGYLDARSIPWQDYPSGNDLRVDDQDGIRTQLAQNNTWGQLQQTTAAPELPELTQSAIFSALAIDEIGLSVTNLQYAELFYGRMLGQAATVNGEELWFEAGNARIRIVEAENPASASVEYYSVLVNSTDLEKAAQAIFAAGGLVEEVMANGFTFWDPDGLRVTVRTPGLF